jgi:ubiquinone biosynthesis protein
MVKIQRPRIKEIIETDIDIMGFIAGLMVKYWPETAFFNPLGIVEEFSRTIRKELDFLEEAKNIARFRRNFQNYPDVFIPGTYPGLVTGKIIVMDKVEGVRIDDIEGISRLGYDMPEIAKKGVKIYFKMLFEDGFFHGDPHPGNLFIMPDGTIGIVDFGIVGWLPPEIVENFAGALIALVHKDFDSLIDQYIELGLLNEEVDIETFKREFKSDLMNFFVPLYDMTISEIDVAQYLDTLTHLAIKHRIRIPSDLLLVNKTMLILDSIGRLLDPNFNLMASAEPYAAKLVQRRYSPERILARAKKYTTDLSDFLITTPKQARLILRRVLKDELQLNMNITGTEKITKDFHRAANRLSFSIIVAAILLSSSMILSSQVGIQVGIIKIAGIPLIPMLGGLTALVLGFWLLVSILRSGKL